MIWNAVLISVRRTTAAQPHRPELLGARISAIHDAIAVGIEIGAAGVLYRPCLPWAVVSIVGDSVAIRVHRRTPVGREAGAGRTPITLVGNAIAIAIGPALRRLSIRQRRAHEQSDYDRGA